MEYRIRQTPPIYAPLKIDSSPDPFYLFFQKSFLLYVTTHFAMQRF